MKKFFKKCGPGIRQKIINFCGWHGVILNFCLKNIGLRGSKIKTNQWNLAGYGEMNQFNIYDCYKEGNWRQIYHRGYWDYQLMAACEFRVNEALKLLKNKDIGANINVLQIACTNNCIEIVDSLINKFSHEWIAEWGMEMACRGGHINIIKLMIKKGANNWNWGLAIACKFYYQEVVKLMIENGATICMNCFEKHQI